MNFGYLRNHATIQGNVKLTMWDGQGNVKYDDTVNGTEDINIGGLHLWDAFEIKYMFASPDGFLHIDFEMEDEEEHFVEEVEHKKVNSVKTMCLCEHCIRAIESRGEPIFVGPMAFLACDCCGDGDDLYECIVG